MKKPKFKRLLAYIVDIFIVAVIASLFIDIPIINPYLDKYVELSEQMITYISGVEPFTQEAINKLQYDFVYYSFYASVILLVVKVLYFIFFQYLNKGKTIGKAIFKIELVSEKRKLKLYQVALSSLVICNIFTQTITLILLRTLDMNAFTRTSNIISYIEFFILITSALMINIRKDSRGIHDIISNTSVVYRKEEKNEDRNRK